MSISLNAFQRGLVGALALLGLGVTLWWSCSGFVASRAVETTPSLLASGLVDTAEARLSNALGWVPGDAAVYEQLGKVLQLKARLRSAPSNVTRSIQAYERAVRLDPLDGRPLAQLGWAYYQLGSYRNASAAFSSALQHDPNNAYYIYSLGLTHMALGDDGRALAELRRAQAIAPDSRIEALIEQLKSRSR